MLDSKKPIRLYDDTGRNEEFNVTKILYEDDDVILVEAFSKQWDSNLKFLIDKKRYQVHGNNILFYLAENV